MISWASRGENPVAVVATHHLGAAEASEAAEATDLEEDRAVSGLAIPMVAREQPRVEADGGFTPLNARNVDRCDSSLDPLDLDGGARMRGGGCAWQ